MLTRSALRPLLERAHTALTRYNLLLKSTRQPEHLFSFLALLEVFSSLGRPSFEQCISYSHLFIALKKESFSEKLICRLAYKLIKQKGYRTQQNWIGPKECSFQEAYYHPPSAKRVPALMKALVRSAHSQKEDALLQYGKFFAQFLIIHPFMDGNGRVARFLLPLFLHQKQSLVAPLFYFSHFVSRHRLRYFQALYAITAEKKWHEWMEFFLKAIAASANKSAQIARVILKLKEELSLESKSARFLFQFPCFNQKAFLKKGGSLATLKSLEMKKVVKRQGKSYLFLPLVNLLKEKAPTKRKARRGL